MNTKLRIRTLTHSYMFFIFSLLLIAGFSQISNAADTKRATEISKYSVTDAEVLSKYGIKEGMILPKDGRKLIRIIDLSKLPKAGIQFGKLNDPDDPNPPPEHCLCVCLGTDCGPPGCHNCPVPLCPGGYFPPCPDGESTIPGLRGVLSNSPVLPKSRVLPNSLDLSSPRELTEPRKLKQK